MWSALLVLSSWASVSNTDSLFVIKDSEVIVKYAVTNAFDSIAIVESAGTYDFKIFSKKRQMRSIPLTEIDSIVFYRPSFVPGTNSGESSSSQLAASSSSLGSSSAVVVSSSSLRSSSAGVVSSSSGLQMNFFIDERDNKAYSYKQLGTAVWMTENLRYLPHVYADEASVISSRYYVFRYYDYDVEEAQEQTHYQTHGVLYNWTAALDDVCPSGWHLPSLAEWNAMLAYTSSGINWLPGGYFDGIDFMRLNKTAYWWSISIDDVMNGYVVSYEHDSKLSDDKGAYFVRCVQGAPKVLDINIAALQAIVWEQASYLTHLNETK